MKHKIIIGDCRKALKTLPSKSIHLVVTSPPYNVNKDYGKWDDSMPLNEYLEFTKEWLTECYRVLTDDGRICINIPVSKYKDNAVDVFQFYMVMKEVGFKDREVIIWAKKRKSDNRFVVKQKIYGTWNPVNPMMRNPIEAILVMNKNQKRLNCSGTSDLTSGEFLRWNYNLWEIDTEADRSHPAPYPVELPKRLIKLYTFPNQIVLDPFLGSGTTTKVAMELKRNSIGIELNPKFVEMIKKRLGENSVTIENVKADNPSPIFSIAMEDKSGDGLVAEVIDEVVDDGYVVIDGIRYSIPERIP